MKKLIIAAVAVFLLLPAATMTFAQTEVHGFLLARTIVTNNNYGERIDRYGLRITQKIDDEFNFLTELYVHPSEADARSRLYMESAFLNWNMKDRVPWDFSVRIGKGRNYCYGLTPDYSSRRTTDYSLYSEAFTQYRVSGFQTFSKFGAVQLALALVNPNTLKSRPLPDFPLGKSIDIPICDRDNDTVAIKNRAAVSGRLSYKTSILNIGADGYVSQTGPDKVGGVKQKNAMNRFGLSGELKLASGLMAQGQFTVATTACDLNANAADGAETELSHNGGEALVGWEKNKTGLYARYGVVTYDKTMPKGIDGLSQIMLSAVYKIRPNVHLRLEGLINSEDTVSGTAKCDNDVAMFECMFAW